MVPVPQPTKVMPVPRSIGRVAQGLRSPGGSFDLLADRAADRVEVFVREPDVGRCDGEGGDELEQAEDQQRRAPADHPRALEARRGRCVAVQAQPYLATVLGSPASHQVGGPAHEPSACAATGWLPVWRGNFGWARRDRRRWCTPAPVPLCAETSRPASARGRITLGSDFVGFTSDVGNHGVTACGASGASRCRPSLG